MYEGGGGKGSRLRNQGLPNSKEERDTEKHNRRSQEKVSVRCRSAKIVHPILPVSFSKRSNRRLKRIKGKKEARVPMIRGKGGAKTDGRRISG